MFCMETVAKIRRRRLVDGETISGIARELRVSRNTVKKYLNQTEPPAYRRSEQPKPRHYVAAAHDFCISHLGSRLTI